MLCGCPVEDVNNFPLKISSDIETDNAIHGPKGQGNTDHYSQNRTYQGEQQRHPSCWGIARVKKGAGG